MASNLLSNMLVRLVFAASYLLIQGESVKPTLTFTQLAAEHGYVAEEHQVTTEDGYILTIFRIPKGVKCHGPTRQPPVLIMHGLLQSADVFLDAGPELALGYLVADDCYDTWFGNVRGNFYSRQHITLDPDRDRNFWQFSVDEMGLYDIPAHIDYVLKVTGAKQLNYLGFSQGGGTFIIMCSERPGYCEKARLFIGLSPATRHLNTRSLIFREISKLINRFRSPIEEFGIWEILTKGDPIQLLIKTLCKNIILNGVVCESLAAAIDSPHPVSINAETFETAFSHAPAGTSTKNAARYGQAMTSREFVKFDYGNKKNIQLYGTPKPPAYNFTAVTVPVVFIQGLNDGIVDIKDSLWASKKLPNLLTYMRVRDPLWNHLDQTNSQFVREMTFPTIKQYLNQYSN